ncbi:hypothetical protein KFE25_005382 [Diacronema lutheri]|uniref:DUF423 domain-containing protein n=2 Tax=Diacronema lutheri TaxID=2081491 RepID=A0A8J5XPH1_DIALT|nr:hypothetical protein KFE25_005382 [Diacronema lutheri]
MAAAVGVITGLSGLTAVAAGAYGAHGLDNPTDYQKKVWERATTYQLAHTGAALAVASRGSSKLALGAGALFLTGNALFSGSLYALVLTGDSQFARVAPYGGGCYMLGWIAVAAAAAL